MKRIVLGLLCIVTLIMSTAYITPPELPSSFYGEVIGGRAGQVVTTNFIGRTTTFTYEGKVVYSMNVTNGTQGARVIFFINGVRAGIGTYRIGTNQNVPLTLRSFRLAGR